MKFQVKLAQKENFANLRREDDKFTAYQNKNPSKASSNSGTGKYSLYTYV